MAGFVRPGALQYSDFISYQAMQELNLNAQLSRVDQNQNHCMLSDRKGLNNKFP